MYGHAWMLLASGSYMYWYQWLHAMLMHMYVCVQDFAGSAALAGKWVAQSHIRTHVMHTFQIHTYAHKLCISSYAHTHIQIHYASLPMHTHTHTLCIPPNTQCLCYGRHRLQHPTWLNHRTLGKKKVKSCEWTPHTCMSACTCVQHSRKQSIYAPLLQVPKLGGPFCLHNSKSFLS